VLSGGFVSRDAFYLFRGERPLGEMIRVERNVGQKIALALFGRAVIRAYPFEPLYFLPLAREVRKAVRLPLVLLGGVKSMRDLQTAMGEGFELAGMARALIHDPSLIAKYAAGRADSSGCVPCNRCVAEMDAPGGVRCACVPEQLAERASALRAAQ
jgi:2,4-dienoyl-CoA reductase-like NADH-dependent reductase (Old Yellow Enzyme family)